MAGNAATGKTTRYARDAFGKVSRVTDPLGHNQDKTYNANNDVDTATDAQGSIAVTTYNTSSQPTSVASPTGAKSTASYNNPAQPDLPDASTDPQGNSSGYTYDTPGNLTAKTSGGVATSATYNPRAADITAGAALVCDGVNAAGVPTGTPSGKPGQPCTTTDGRGNQTKFAYDTGGNLRITTPPTGVIKLSTFAYDNAGRLKTKVDGNNRTTTYVYDTLDRVLQVRYNGATTCTTTDITADNCIKYTYTTDGALASRADTAGTSSYTYDRGGRQTSQTLPAASAGGISTVQLGYDPSGNLTSHQDTAVTTAYGYDAGNNLVRLGESATACQVPASNPPAYYYTGATSTDPAALPPAGTKCTVYGYDTNDTRTRTVLPGGTVTTATVDKSHRPTQLTAQLPGGSTVMNFGYDYSKAGQDSAVVTSRTDYVTASQPVQTYLYDGLNRLGQVLEKPSGGTTTGSWTYCYDQAGNRTYDTTSLSFGIASCAGVGSTTAATYTYDNTNALTGRTGQPASAFAYDGNGNEYAAAGGTVRTAGTFSVKNQQLTTTTDGTAHTAAYAGSGQTERTSLDNTKYQNTPLGLTTQTTNNGGVFTTTRFIREPGGAPVALRVGAISYYYITDNQGTVISVVNGAGQEFNRYGYDPYGNSRGKTEGVANPLQYTGGQLDATGLYHLGARYYDTTLGRFTQPDPTGQDPHYTYAGNNPTNNTDLTGRDFLGDVSTVFTDFYTYAGAGAATGFVTGAVVCVASGVGCLAAPAFTGVGTLIGAVYGIGYGIGEVA